jgi:hypothetical protein
MEDVRNPSNLAPKFNVGVYIPFSSSERLTTTIPLVKSVGYV